MPSAASSRHPPATDLAISAASLGSGRIVLATDFDRTLTGPDLVPDPAALAAVAAWRNAGNPCILVTGRPLDDFRHDPGLLHQFDGLVLEGGAVWGRGSDLVHAENGQVALQCAERLRAQGVVVEVRTASFSAWVRDGPQVEAEAGNCTVARNADRLDVLPPGHDKGTGLATVRTLLGLDAARMVAIGDGDNDIPLLAAADLGLAVGAASPALRQVAHHWIPSPGPQAVAAAVHALLSRPTAHAFPGPADPSHVTP